MKRYELYADDIFSQMLESNDGDFVKWEDIEQYIKFAEIVYANKWSIPVWMRNAAEKLFTKKG